MRKDAQEFSESPLFRFIMGLKQKEQLILNIEGFQFVFILILYIAQNKELVAALLAHTNPFTV